MAPLVSGGLRSASSANDMASHLRPFRSGDEADLVRQANNPNVALRLRDYFPQPYTWRDAEEWVRRTSQEKRVLNFAIIENDRVIGGIGLMPGADIHRVSAEVGYWLGEAYWGRGICSAALVELMAYAFATLDELNRLFAYVDEENRASIRVLEKAGFRREGQLIGAAIKQGRIHNQFLYGLTRAEARPINLEHNRVHPNQ
jgi:ribosomal-protein-alanine N-acetyltransferase